MSPRRKHLALALVAGLAAASLGAASLGFGVAAEPPARVTIVLDVTEKTVNILGTPFTAWTFNGGVPGPILRVTQGTELTIVLRNQQSEIHSFHSHFQHYPLSEDGSSATLPFSITPHQSDDPQHAMGLTASLMDGAHLDPDVGVNPIGPYEPRMDMDVALPGGEYAYHLVASEVGTFLYHCHVFPVSEHIARGLFGMIIVYPKGWTWTDIPDTQPGLPGTDAWVTAANGTTYYEDVAILSELDPTMLTEKAGLPLTEAGKIQLVNFRAWNDPYYLGPVSDRTPMRVIVANMGNAIHSWHIHGHNFDVLDKFDPAKRVVYRADTIMVGPGESYETTLIARFPGFWFVHDHMNAQSTAGMIAWLSVQE